MTRKDSSVMEMEKQNVQENGKDSEAPTPFDEAVAQTGTGRFHVWLLMVCGLCLASVMIEIYSSSFLLPTAQCEFQLTSEDKGMLSAICNIGMVCSSHLWGFLADTKGRRNVIVLTLFLDSICSIVESFAHAFWLLLILRFCNGFLIMGPTAVTYAYLGEFHSSATRSMSIMWVCVFIGLGVCLQPGIAWAVIPRAWSFQLPWCTYKSWRIFLFICALPGLLTAILMRFTLPESPKFLMAMGHEDQALKVLQHMYSKNTGNSPEKFPVKSLILVEESSAITTSHSKNPILAVVQHMWVQTKPLFQSQFLFKTLLACSIQYGLYASANGLSLWVPDIFNKLAEHAAISNNTSFTVCDAYAPSDFQQNTPVIDLPEHHSAIYTKLNTTVLPHDNDIIYQNIRNDTSLLYSNNDSLVLHCSNDTIVTLDSEKFSLQQNDDTVNLTCKNSTVLLNFNSDSTFHNSSNSTVMLNLSINNSLVVLKFLKTEGWRSMTIHSCSGVEAYCTSDYLSDMKNNPPVCTSNVDITAFQYSFIIGAVESMGFIFMGFIINHVGKKSILVCSLLTAGVAGASVNLVYSPLEVLLLVGTFIMLSGMCISVVTSVVIDIFPTHYRAMATCLSLMVGRTGAITVNFMLGALLEVKCTLVIYVLGGLCISCGLLSLLLPSAKKHILK